MKKGTKQNIEHIKKRTISRKLNNSFWHSEETKNKLKIKALKQFKNGMPEETKKKLLGRKAWNKNLKYSNPKVSIALKGKKHTKEHNKKIKESCIKNCHPPILKGKENNRYGKTPIHPKRYNYKGYCFRSSWELMFAKFLDSRNLTWEYEPKRFYFENCSYLPDFYVYEWFSYIEIKGWLKDSDIDKIKLFYEKYPDEELIVFDYQILNKLNIIK